MKALFPALLFFLWMAAPQGWAKETAVYLDPAAIDFKALLGDPPADDSATTRQEIAEILQDQQTRTPDEVKRAQREAAHLDVFLFDTVIGPWFKADKLPATAKFFGQVRENAGKVSERAKKFWNRKRPYLLDSRVHPAVELPKNASYPSGHSTLGNLYALVLAQLLPDQSTAILARGKQVGEDRIIAGVHYRSDVVAGEKLAQAIFAQFMANSTFTADLAKARAEMDAVRSSATASP